MDLFKTDRGDPCEVAEDDHLGPSASGTDQLRRNFNFSRLTPGFTMPRSKSFDSPRIKALRLASSTDFLSPSKEGEVPMDYSPCAKSPATFTFRAGDMGDSLNRVDLNRPISQLALHPASQNSVEQQHSGATCPIQCEPSAAAQPGLSDQPGPSGQPQRATSLEPLPFLSDSDSEADSESSHEMQPEYIFKLSPGSPPYEIDYPPHDPPMEGHIELVAKHLLNVEEPKLPPERAKKQSASVRRWHSQELRKHLLDMSNTPPNAYSSRRSLFKRPMDVENSSTPVKRPKDNSVDVTMPGSNEKAEEFSSESSPDLTENHERIKTAVDALQCSDLIADGTRTYCLPVVPGKHSDLKNIEPATMANILRGHYMDRYDKLTVIDCRYPYEYVGGHIQGAINVYTENDLSEFLNCELTEIQKTAHKHILIFHCEFSSQRGPSLLRHLRKADRELNLHQYPQLTFPEVYCLFGGYKDFFNNFPELCEPSAYITMNDEQYSKELRYFRAKAKTWTAGEKFRRK